MGGRIVLVLSFCVAGCDSEPEDSGEKLDAARQCESAYEAPERSTEYRSNTPDAQLEMVHTEEAQGLTVISSNFVQDDDNPDGARWWLGEIRNDGDEILCFPKAGLLFMTAQGEVMSAMDLFFDAPAYEGSIEASMPCLAPGEHGFGSTLDTSPFVAPAEALGTIRVSFDATARPDAVPHPLAPGLSAAQTSADGRLLEGTLCNGGEALRFVWVYGYARDERGLVVREWDDFYDGILEPDTAWEYSIDEFEPGPAPADLALFVTFDPAGPGADAP